MFAAVVFLLLAGWAVHAPLLRGVAGLMIVDEPAQPGDVIAVRPYGDRRFDEAARLHADQAGRRILFLAPKLERTEALGIRPGPIDVFRGGLAIRKVPAAALAVTPGAGARTAWDEARNLGRWLTENPGASAAVLCDEFETRRMRYILDSTLVADAARVRVTALPHRWFDKTHWWQSKDGLKHVFTNGVGLAYAVLCGEDTDPWREWDPDQYQAALQNR